MTRLDFSDFTFRFTGLAVFDILKKSVLRFAVSNNSATLPSAVCPYVC